MDTKELEAAIYVSSEEFEELTRRVAERIQTDGFAPEMIVCINRGGMYPSRKLSDFLDINQIYSTGATNYDENNQPLEKPVITQRLDEIGPRLRGRRVLVVDEVCQTGGTMEMIVAHVHEFNPLEVRTAVLHVKPQRVFEPDYHNGSVAEWVVYHWETEEYKRFLARQEEEQKG